MRDTSAWPGVVLCLFAATAWSDPGREYWAVMSEGASGYDFSVVVSNPDPALTASVAVHTEDGPLASASVAPLSSHEFNLGQGRKVSGSALGQFAYRVLSDVPIHASQFIIWSLRAGTLQASLLVERASFATDYLVLAAPADTADLRPSVVTLVAPQPARVTVVPSTATQAGAGVGALAAGEPLTVDLEAFDVLQIAGLAGGDLSGTAVTSDAPVEVFGGCHNCIIDGSAQDLVQEVMMPPSWWGSTVAAVASNPLTPDVNRWRILASADGTTVTTDPAMPGTPTTLDRGEYVEFPSAADFAVSASAPVLVGRYNTLGTVEPWGGDPAMCLMLPEERFIRSALFALPTGSGAANWLDLVARAGTTVTVDGAVVPAASFSSVGSSGLLHAQVVLSASFVTHTVEADQPVAAYAGNSAGARAMTFPVDIHPPPNLAPTCDHGGPYTVDCAGPSTSVPLSGSASSDPEGAPLSFAWSSTPAVTFDDATIAMPVATVTGLGTFPLNLEISDGANRVICSTTTTVTGDATPPGELSLPPKPLWLAKRPAGSVVFSWEDRGGAPVSYNLYEGTIRSIWSHATLACAEAGLPASPGRREATLAAGAGSTYYLVSASNCVAEGPTGGDLALSVCPP